MKISVYITSYNQKQYLTEAIESVLAQTYKPHQIIIVDDASQDGSQALIAGYQSQYPNLILPIYHPQNLGVAQTRNDALQAVTGELVTYLDGDDRFLPEKLAVECSALRDNSQARVAFSNVYIINTQGQRISLWATSPPPQGEVFLETFSRTFPRSRLFRNELIHYLSWREIGFYDPSLAMYEDYEMRVRLTKHLKVVYTGQPLIEYRRHHAGLSRSGAQRYLEAFDYIRRKNQPLLDDLSDHAREQVGKKLDAWKAELIRRRGREALNGSKGAIDRRLEALHYYHMSLHYHSKLDVKFLIDFCLPRGGYAWLQNLSTRFRQRRFRMAKR